MHLLGIWVDHIEVARSKQVNFVACLHRKLNVREYKLVQAGVIEDQLVDTCWHDVDISIGVQMKSEVLVMLVT